MSKYYARACWVNVDDPDGIYAEKPDIEGNYRRFDSKGEARRFLELKLLLRVGEIRDLKLQADFYLQDKLELPDETLQPIKIVVDFYYYDIERRVFILEDFKGHPTALWKLKWKMLKCLLQDDIINGKTLLLVTGA